MANEILGSLIIEWSFGESEFVLIQNRKCPQRLKKQLRCSLTEGNVDHGMIGDWEARSSDFERMPHEYMVAKPGWRRQKRKANAKELPKSSTKQATTHIVTNWQMDWFLNST